MDTPFSAMVLKTTDDLYSWKSLGQCNRHPQSKVGLDRVALRSLLQDLKLEVTGTQSVVQADQAAVEATFHEFL